MHGFDDTPFAPSVRLPDPSASTFSAPFAWAPGGEGGRRSAGPCGRRSGLANLSDRAHRRGGTLSLENQEQGGLRLRWSIPL